MLMQDVRQLLPIGTVVRLKGATKLLMVFGVRQTDGKTNREYDYIAVTYPEGNMGENIRFMFDHSDIDEIVHTGYESAQKDLFLQKLHDFFSGKEDSEQE